MRRFLLLAPFMAAFALPASAQTILSLSATGTAHAMPDEAVAHFEAQATKPDAATAQSMVNEAITKALAVARALPGVEVTTGRYNTYSTEAKNQTGRNFIAQQSLTLVQPATNGIPDKAFSDLLGKLQASGLLLTGLGGDLSPQGANTLHKEAISNALMQLRSDANSIAATLHEKVGSLQTLNIDTSGGFISPRIMSLAAAAPVAPQSAPEPLSDSVRVSANIKLEPAS